MGGVLQSGNVTPGHLARWAADGAIGDAGVTQKVLAAFFNADFNTTSDQPLILPNYITAFQLTGILVTNSAISLTTAAGGFYPQPLKAGTPLVDAGQVYSSLTSAAKLLTCTLDASVATTRYSIGNLPNWAIYFSLTTAQGVNANADIYVLGTDLSP